MGGERVPSRVIRGEINRSDSLARVSMQAELTFDRLLTAVDDYGRLDARPAALKAELFPMRAEVSPEMVWAWVRELASIPDAPVLIYVVARRPYLQLVNWERHRGTSKRSGKSKFPDPPETPEDSPGLPGISGEPPEILKSPSESRESGVEGRESRVESREQERSASPPDRVSPGVLTSIEQAFGAYGKHPRGWGEVRRKALRARAAEHGVEALVQAVHGYAWMHRRPGNGFDPLAHLTPETIYRPGNFAKYLDAYGEAIASGREPPFPREAVGANGRGPTVAEMVAQLDAEAEARRIMP